MPRNAGCLPITYFNKERQLKRIIQEQKRREKHGAKLSLYFEEGEA
jgi:hypothetical protein